MQQLQIDFDTPAMLANRVRTTKCVSCKQRMKRQERESLQVHICQRCTRKLNHQIEKRR